MTKEKRRATRILLNAPALVEPIPLPRIEVHDNLAEVYERVNPSQDRIGNTYQTSLRDLSTNGAFLAGEPVPLLTRVACTFNLDGYGPIEALGWCLWRRTADCKVPRPDGSMVSLPQGFGILFEAIPLDARFAIHKLVDAASN